MITTVQRLVAPAAAKGAFAFTAASIDPLRAVPSARSSLAIDVLDRAVRGLVGLVVGTSLAMLAAEFLGTLPALVWPAPRGWSTRVMRSGAERARSGLLRQPGRGRAPAGGWVGVGSGWCGAAA